jgi:molybdopterin molybdotransferase
MKGFFQLVSSSEFIRLFDNFSPLRSEEEAVALCRGRILAQDIQAPEDLPHFARSTMDGYAVRAADTFGCSESEPALLKITGEIPMGRAGREISLHPGHAATIWTGGELPLHGNGVVMKEYTNRLDADTIEIFRPVAPGENVISSGEDFARGSTVLEKGQVLRPQDLGVLSGLGLTGIPVFRKPVVAILSTGDELIDPGQSLAPGKIRDINTTTLHALIEESGGLPVSLGIVKDDPDRMFKACTRALEIPADMVLLSGGSSVGRRDFTLRIFEKIDHTELLAHGVSIKPGKPTILARKGNVALFGLPGHAGSAIVVFYLFVRPLLRKLAGNTPGPGMQVIRTVTTQQIPSTIGREDYVRVAVTMGDKDAPNTAMPVYGKSGLLSPLIRADGLLVIGRDVEGLDKGEQAEVMLFP